MGTPDFDLKEELEELKALAFQKPEMDWQKGIAKNPWVLLGLLSIALTSMGVMFGKLSSGEEREHDEFRQAIRAMQSSVALLDRKVDSQEERLARYGDDSARSMKIMEEFARENYQRWKTIAEDHGDRPTVVRMDKKLKALNVANTGGTP